MAEFTTVLKQLRRMCANNACNDCPVYDKYCRVLGIMSESEVERIVMHWAAEHPEPKYPTWEEWQKETFPEAADKICPLMFTDFKSADCNKERLCAECRTQHIPAQIAKKLGIKPKGGNDNDERD